MRSDSVKNVSAYADQNHAPSLAAARLECKSMASVLKKEEENRGIKQNND